MSNEGALQGLYPVLHRKVQTPEKLNAVLLQSVAEKARDSRRTNECFFEEQAKVLVTAARTPAEVYRCNGRLFSMGNGVSSCDANHLTVEFVHSVTAGRPALAATNLGTDLATIGLAGGDGGRMRSSGAVDHCLVVPATSIHGIQESHVAAYHILWDLVHTLLVGECGSATKREVMQ